MSRKTAPRFALTVLVLLSTSCTMWSTKEVGTVAGGLAGAWLIGAYIALASF